MRPVAQQGNLKTFQLYEKQLQVVMETQVREGRRLIAGPGDRSVSASYLGFDYRFAH